jgi:aminomethyltransferase
MVEFGGWEMPIQYTGILDEHKAVRSAAGIFDISHMGEVLVRGRAAEAFLNSVLTNDIAKLQPGHGQYTLLCNADGGVLDDLFAYRLGADDYLLIINASRIEADTQWLNARWSDFPSRSELQLTNASEQLAAVAVQGPAVVSIIDAIAADWKPAAGSGKASELKRNQITGMANSASTAWFARTGYTGEDGFEIVAPGERIAEFWDRSLALGASHGLKPCGLGARDTLRTEMCFPLYGHELTTEVTPIEAGLEPFVALHKPSFSGRETLLNQKNAGPCRRMVAFRMREPGTPPPRPHYSIWADASDPAPLGECTSGTLSPSLGVGIGLGYVPRQAAEPGTTVFVEVRGRRHPALIVKKPLYRRPPSSPAKAV